MLGLSLGCSFSDEPPFGNVCPRTMIDYCNVREADCQSTIQAYVACLAEVPPVSLPPTRTSTAWRSGRDLVDRLAPLRPALVALRLATIEPEATRTGEVGYQDGTVVFVGARPWRDQWSMVMMAYAQSRWLYEQRYQLEAQVRAEPDFDGAMAVQSTWVVAAGIQADLLGNALFAESYDPSFVRSWAERAAFASNSAFDAWPERYGRGLGSFRLWDEWASSGNPALEAALEDPPTSTFELSSGAEPGELLLPELPALPEALEGFEVAASAPVGSSMVELFAQSLQLRISAHARRDRLYRLRPPTPTSEAVLWVIDLEAPAASWQAERPLPFGIELSQRAERLLVAFSPKPEIRAALFEIGGPLGL